MKLLHMSDLHLGKRVNGFSMLEDQKEVLQQIVDIAKQERPDAVLIAGDVYDKPVPPAEAVTLFDWFLQRLSELHTAVCVISGNHDSPERLSFASALLCNTGIYLSPVYQGQVEPISITDADGTVDLYLLPFLKPATVRPFFPDAALETYTDALRCAIEQMPLCPDHRNVLVTHQFVTGAQRCESESIQVGGTDNVDSSVFDGFDYVALGHLHGPQNVGSEGIRYCGSPLKYSFSEVNQQKSVTIVELGPKGSRTVRTVGLTPVRDLVCIRGTYLELTDLQFYQTRDREAYYHITLTDEQDIPQALGRLKTVYPNLMRLEYDNARTRSKTALERVDAVEQLTPKELFGLFYMQQNGSPMTQEQETYIERLIETIWGEAL